MINVGELILNNATDEHYNVYPNIDAKYGPYESIEIALTNVPKSQRAIGLTIGIKSNNSITEYWFKNSIEDSGLITKGNTVDLSDYYTKSQIDASQRTQDNKIVAAENRLTSAENKIVSAENNISGLETSVQELQNTVGQPSIYTRGRVKKLHIKIGGIGNAVNFVPIVAPIKYNSNFVISFTTDDASCSTLDVIWAAFNGRKVAKNKGEGDTQYSYHANQYLAGDIPDTILADTQPYTAPFEFYDCFGNPHRFKQGVAIWPYAGNKDGMFMDKESVVNPSAGNLYRFMTPYLMWEDCNLLKKYGVDFYWHNIGTEEYGADKDINNVIQGLTADFLKTQTKLGFNMKCLARPDGNNTFIDAMVEMPRVDIAVAENDPGVDLYPYILTDMYHKTYLRTFKEDIDTIKSEIQAIANNTDPSTRKWYHFCCHTATTTWTGLLEWIKEQYGGNSTTPAKAWIATVGELYEYMYYRKYIKFTNIKTTTDNGVNYLEFDLDFPYKENFCYKDLTLNIICDNLSNSDLTIDGYDTYTNEKIIQASVKYISPMIVAQIGIEDSATQYTDYFINKYRETKKDEWKLDAETSIAGYRSDLKQSYQDIIDDISGGGSGEVPITDITFSKDSINIGLQFFDTIDVTFLPANNTEMDSVAAYIENTNIASITKDSVTNNVIRYTIIAVAVGNTNIKFSIGGVVSTKTVPVIITGSTGVPITSIDFTPTELAFTDNEQLVLSVVASPDNNTWMSKITCTDTDSNCNWQIISNIAGNIKTFTIKNLYTVAGDYIGEFDVAVKNSDIIQRIPYSLHINSQSTEKPIESATIIGPSTALTNEVVTVNLICVPTDNTQMNDLTITPDSGCSVSDKSIAGNELTFLVTFSHSGSFDIVIDNPNTDDSWTYQVVVSDPPVSQDDNTVCFVNYGLNDLNKVRYFDDTLYGGRININEMNYESTIERTPIYSKSGKVLTGWERYCQNVDTIIADSGLTQAGEWRMGGSQNGDLTSVFSVASEATCEYRYLYQYGGAQSDGWALKVPNGQYKIRILTCTSETNDKYINFNTFKINGENVLDQLPLEKALTNNTEWVEFNPITVYTELIWIYAAVAAKARCGINAIEIIKL